MPRFPHRAPQGARFDTEFGPCGIAWSKAGITRLYLPGEPGLADLPALPDTAPAFVARAAEALRTFLAGTPSDLAAIPVDLEDQPPFTRRVLVAARSIPAGRTETYGALAARIGRPGAARAVGQAMARNPVPLLVPCHRVLGTLGGLCGFSAAGGTAMKRRLLDLEA